MTHDSCGPHPSSRFLVQKTAAVWEWDCISRVSLVTAVVYCMTFASVVAFIVVFKLASLTVARRRAANQKWICKTSPPQSVALSCCPHACVVIDQA